MEAGLSQDPSGLQRAFDRFSRKFANFTSPFQTQLGIDTHMAVSDTKTVVVDTQTVVVDTKTMVADMHQKMLAEQGGASCKDGSVCTTCCPSEPNAYHRLDPSKVSDAEYYKGSADLRLRSTPLGESPPPAPRDCFGRDELIEEVVGFAENLRPVALIGAGGIGKTSIALTVLHHDRIKERFGGNRRFIRCDQFPATCAHFLARLSEVIGAGVENPKDLRPLRPILSSKKTVVILDNAESILDPKGTNAEEIYSVVDELSQFNTIFLLITSRITTLPPRCKRPEIPTLSMKAACDIFYDIYGDHGRSTVINDLLERLDFHALSITLLATTASHNAWDYNRLAEEWDTKRAQVLRTDYNKSLAATIELSLASPTFRSLGPNARDLLGVVAFFPQGINEKNLDWLLPTIINGRDTFDKFCALSLTHRSNGFVTMLAPIRDYLGPRDPRSSPLLCTTRDRYFSRLSIDLSPVMPEFEETRWVLSEDANIEHLLDVSATIDPEGDEIWEACYHFMEHLYWHRPRQIMLRLKIEALPDDHGSKAKCLSELSRLLGQVGNYTEQKRLLTHALKLERRRGVDFWVAYTLRQLSEVNRHLRLYKEGIGQAEEALKIFERIDGIAGQLECLDKLAWLLYEDGQLDAAEKAASRAMGLAADEDGEFTVCRLHRVLGEISQSKGEKEKAIHHFETSIGIASSSNWNHELFWNHIGLATLFCGENDFANATAHTEQARSHAEDEPYKLGRTMRLQASIWYRQLRLEDAKSEALRALEIFEKLGAAKAAEGCNDILQEVERAMADRLTSF